MSRILVVVAHPDDEVLGCGGTIAKHIANGDSVHCLILSNGVTSKFNKEEMTTYWVKEAIEKRISEAVEASRVLGTKLLIRDYPDQKFDSIPMLDIVQAIERIRNSHHFDIVYTHHEYDLNMDHKITYWATLTAFRKEPIAFYTFEIPTSTWSILKPNTFVNITRYFDKKLEAINKYKSENIPTDSIISCSKYRATGTGCHFVEAFKLIKEVR